ncbi:hypothetical protein BDK51DRAFT_40665 [Blyttiomyces helicus]|uniref:Uncharacterized protein n=1 Tax=Blyttiomyces helicus TaxID=388810 RepID=A0A4P9W8N1_9FUNG|nr:hypothetical protein BDK51DRAFT_40665 [Blyttiomyces helicus]|eukprot:RKO88889.1 hypothetical protein BDK51DRAFT_40665 [Blyttiomyces helicus]
MDPGETPIRNQDHAYSTTVSSVGTSRTGGEQLLLLFGKDVGRIDDGLKVSTRLFRITEHSRLIAAPRPPAPCSIRGSHKLGTMDSTSYVKYLFEGSGVENNLDYGAIRREMENMSSQSFANQTLDYLDRRGERRDGGRPGPLDTRSREAEESLALVRRRFEMAANQQEVGEERIPRDRGHQNQESFARYREDRISPTPAQGSIGSAAPYRPADRRLHTESLQSHPAHGRDPRSDRDQYSMEGSQTFRPLRTGVGVEEIEGGRKEGASSRGLDSNLGAGFAGGRKDGVSSRGPDSSLGAGFAGSGAGVSEPEVAIASAASTAGIGRDRLSSRDGSGSGRDIGSERSSTPIASILAILAEQNALNQDVCVKLEINNIEGLESALDTIETVLRLVPQMEEAYLSPPPQFATSVHEAVWTHKSRLTGDSDSDTDRPRAGHPVPRKMPDTLRVVRGWARDAAEIEVLKDFRRRVLATLRVPEHGSVQDCLAEIRNLAGGSKGTRGVRTEDPNDASHKAVAQFCDLFEVRTSEVIPRMKSLYVFWVEVQDGLDRVREALNLNDTMPAGRVLIHAAEAIISLEELSAGALDGFVVRKRASLSSPNHAEAAAAATTATADKESVHEPRSHSPFCVDDSLDDYGSDRAHVDPADDPRWTMRKHETDSGASVPVSGSSIERPMEVDDDTCDDRYVDLDGVRRAAESSESSSSLSIARRRVEHATGLERLLGYR